MRDTKFRNVFNAAFLRLMLLALGQAVLPATAHGQSEDPVLERYVIGHGGTLPSDGGNVNAFIHDDRFGGGTAQASMFFDAGADGDFLHLRVWRHVPADRIVFALLVFRVEVRGYDATGQLVHSRDLPDFSFGDSQSGNWTRKLRVPKKAQRWEISYIGNYE